MQPIDKSMHRIGLAGVGLMGLGIATNILKHGWRLSFLDHPGNQPVQSLVEQGARGEASGAALASQCDVLILCVTGSPQVSDVLLRDDGLLKGLRENALVIDCSTAIPSSTTALAAQVVQAGGRFLDAPMTRTPKEAMEGRLNLIVGGEARDFEFALPLFHSFAEHVTHVGAVGAGHTMKLLHNYVSLGFTAVLTEAAAAAAKSGIAPEKLVDVLAKGGGKSVVLDRLAPFILEGDVSGLKFSVANARKDIDYYNRMADDLGAEKRTAQGVLALLEAQLAEGNGEKMLPELVRILAGKS
ncbi:MAG: NAD(P)-dependent oxidoreductase [Nitratireductor sp.]|nr:NAD(P)-dependent oxidoreductase [Nitratireductor sp.]